MPKIIIAEDYDGTRNIIRDYISRRYPQIEIESFETCEEAFEKMKREKTDGGLPDLLLTNYMNRGRYNGLQLTEKVRMEISQDVLIYVMSSSSVEKEAMQAGATGYLVKPFRFPELDAIFERLHPSKQDSQTNSEQ